MSESDDDSFQNNICLTFQNDNTTMCARGPKFNSTNMTGLSFRNNGLTSTMNMTAANACQEGYGDSMSLRSAPIYRPSSSTYRNGMGSHRSMYNGRAQSSASVHSVDTTASVISAADIVFAFNNGKINKYDLLTIKEACNKLMKNQRRKRIEKRRKLKLFFKGMRRKSGEDSGEQGSDSSISDDCRSIRTTICKENIPVMRQKRNFPHFGTNVQISKYPVADVTHFPDTMRDNPLFIDRTTAIKRNTFRNMISCSNSSSSFVAKDRFVNTVGTYEYNSLKNHTISAINQKVGSEFLMPPQKNNRINTQKQHLNKVNNDYDKRTGKTNVMQNIVDSSNLAGIENDSDEDQNPMSPKLQNTTVISQKDRFKKGFLLPYQRFNQTVAAQEKDVSKLFNDENRTKRTRKNNNNPQSQAEQKSDSDEEEIFRGFSDNPKDKNSNKKRAPDAEDHSNRKKNRTDSPKIQSFKPPESKCSNISKEQPNDFIFAKPKVPVKKVNSIKDSLPEKLLAKSRVPPIEEEIEFNFIENNNSDNIVQDKTGNHLKDNTQSDIPNCNSDVSLRPSFIKRKLFTQKLDMAENKNASCDSIGTNSPQNIYSASIRERSKARKLVSSQSCLSREVPGEDNNVLELIHKIVPPDQINMTSVANKTQSRKNKTSVDNTEKWDVSTVIANCDDQDVSDTYTDEEIFNVNCDKISEKPTKLAPNSNELPQCKIVVEKLKTQTINETLKNSNNNEQPQTKLLHKERNKNNVTAWMKSVWDTDSDCDMQFNVIRPWNARMQRNEVSLLEKANQDLRDKQNQNIKKTSNFNSNILSVRNCNRNSKLNGTLKSSVSHPHINIAKSVVEGKANSNIDKDKYGTNATSETSAKNRVEKQNVLVNTKNSEPVKKSKAKQPVDFNQSDKPIKVTKNLNGTYKAVKNDKKSDNKDNNNKNIANNNKLPPEPVVKSKDSKNLDAKKNNKTTNEITKSGQKQSNTKKDPVRTQPKRKSKENSYTQSPDFKRLAKKRKLSNLDAKDKFSKELATNNTSLNSTMTTRSRSKLCNSSGYNSSNNLSNISNRSLRSINREIRMKT